MHQVDPKATLLQIAQLLGPGGWLIALKNRSVNRRPQVGIPKSRHSPVIGS